MEITSDWAIEGTSGTSAGSSRGSTAGAVVQVLVRKATGGAKGISRSLEGLSSAPETAGLHSVGSPVVPLSVVALETLVQVNPVSGPTTSRPGPDAADGTHDALGLPFNLSLTEEQRRRRGDVPIPYAHEGEGVELGWEEEEDDEDDEEI
jgi:elongator complex protein 5